MDQESYHAIAKAGERVVGLLGTLHFDLHFRDESLKTAYLLDFRVDPDYRQGLTAFRMVRSVVEREQQAGSRLALATLLKNNEAPMVFTRGRGGFPASLYLGDNKIFNIVPIRHLRPDPGFTIGPPDPADIPEMVNLYNRFYARYRLAPRITEELFRSYIAQIEGLGLDSFRVARQDGRILAVLAAWDEEPFKRYWVTRKSLSISVVTGLIRLISLFTRMPARIHSHQPLPQLTLALWAHDDSIAALASLIRSVNNENLGGKYSLIQIHVHEEDPALEALKGMSGVTIRNEIHLFTDTLQLAREIQGEKGPVHLEFPGYI
ncbi:MAG: GNAT family N-acetyltransferase [Bacteroidales bacterium]